MQNKQSMHIYMAKQGDRLDSIMVILLYIIMRVDITPFVLANIHLLQCVGSQKGLVKEMR